MRYLHGAYVHDSSPRKVKVPARKRPPASPAASLSRLRRCFQREGLSRGACPRERGMAGLLAALTGVQHRARAFFINAKDRLAHKLVLALEQKGVWSGVPAEPILGRQALHVHP